MRLYTWILYIVNYIFVQFITSKLYLYSLLNIYVCMFKKITTGFLLSPVGNLQ
jgi:hypothetical protein